MRIHEIKYILNKYDLSLDEFLKWIEGKPKSKTPDGSIDFFEYDIQKYLKKFNIYKPNLME